MLAKELAELLMETPDVEVLIMEFCSDDFSNSFGDLDYSAVKCSLEKSDLDFYDEKDNKYEDIFVITSDRSVGYRPNDGGTEDEEEGL